MKQLLLLRCFRHRTTESSNLADYHRPLKRRGEIAAMKLGAIMQQKQHFPDLAICATPTRARQTLAFIWPFLTDAQSNKPNLIYDFKIHDMRGVELLHRLQQLDAEVDKVLLVSTPPGISDLAKALWKPQNNEPSPFVEHLPPGGLAVLTCEAASWTQLTAGMCNLSELII